MEGEVGTREIRVVAFNGENVFLSGLEDFGDSFEGEVFEFVVRLMVGKAIGGGSLFFIDTLAVDFMAVEVGDEGVVVGNGESEFVGIRICGEIEFTTDVEGGEFSLHVDDGGVVIITVAEAGLAGFPGGDVVIRSSPVGGITSGVGSSKVGPFGIAGDEFGGIFGAGELGFRLPGLVGLGLPGVDDGSVLHGSTLVDGEGVADFSI